MTAKTSQHLADTLRAAGFEELAKRAETDEFHDYLSPHDFPELTLDQELVQIIIDAEKTGTHRVKTAAMNIRSRHHEGEFDANSEESDEWAESPEGRDAFEQIAKEVGSKLEGVSSSNHQEMLRTVAKNIDATFNGTKRPRTFGFALLLFKFNKVEKGHMDWISNADRKDMIVALKEMIAQLEGRIGGKGHG